MPKINVYTATKNELIKAPIPLQTRTYKPVSNEGLIDLTLESIHRAGFEVQTENYTMAKFGEVANGRYTIRNIEDTEMQIQVGWQNSYNKQLTVKYALGVHIFICDNGCVSGEMGAFKKKHQGDVQEFTPKYVSEYLKTAGDVFLNMQKERDTMKNIELSKRVTAELIGRMYLESNVIEAAQLTIIKNQLLKPSFDYNAPNSLWELYQFVTYSMKGLHPSLWMDSHIDAHKFFTDNANIIVPEMPTLRLEPEMVDTQMSLFEEM